MERKWWHDAVVYLAGGGKMILGSDSHTRYGALGTMAMGEGGPELVKQLLNKTYDIKMPGVVAIYLDGEPSIGVGPAEHPHRISAAPGLLGAHGADGPVSAAKSTLVPQPPLPAQPAKRFAPPSPQRLLLSPLRWAA